MGEGEGGGEDAGPLIAPESMPCMWACGSAGRRIARTIAPRSGRAAPFYACGSAACIVAAIAVAEASRPPDSLQIAVLGVLLGVSTVVGMAIMSTPVPPGPRTGGADARRRGGHGTPIEGGGGGWPGTDRAFSAALGTVAAVIAIAAIAAAATPAPDSGATWNEWLTRASAACHDTASGCGRAALTGGGMPHILSPPPVITGAGVPATVSISGLLGDDAGPPTRITASVGVPVGVRGAQSAPAPPHSCNHTVMTTQDGRWSVHYKIDVGMRPGTYDYAVSTTYTERPSGFAVHVDAGTFAVTVLEPRPSHSSPPPLPPRFPGGNGDGDGGDGGGDTDADNGSGTAGGPVHIIDGIVRFNAVQGPASAVQAVAISFAYGDGLPRESSVLVRGPLPDGPVRLGPAHVLAAQHADEAKFAHEFIVQPTWPAGTCEAVVRHGGGGGGGPAPRHVWMGTSVENNAAARRIAELRKVQCYIRFVSFEPLLEEMRDVDLSGIDWAIMGGGESGPHHRPIRKGWVKSLIRQCRRDGVRVFFKQWGGPRPKAGGRAVDGQVYSEYPAGYSRGPD